MSEHSEFLSKQRQVYEDDLDLFEIVKVIWKGKFWIIGVTLIAAVLSVLFALRQPNVYLAEALLVMDDPNAGAYPGLTQVGGLAGLAGLALPPIDLGEKAVGIATLQSREFMAEFMERHNNILPDLMAIQSYDSSTGDLVYDPVIFDSQTGVWTRNVEPPLQKKPSPQEAFLIMTDILSVIEDPDTGFVTVSIEHVSPVIASQWVTWLIDDLNREMMLEAIDEAEKSIEYLTEQLDSTQVVALDLVFYSLIEEATKTIMLANSRPEYLFKTIDPAIAPESKIGPNRPLISVLGTLLGGILSVLGVLIWHYVFGVKRNAQPS